MRVETKSSTAYCLMIAWAWGAWEEICSEGLRKKFTEAGSSIRRWRQKGKVGGRRSMFELFCEHVSM
jgi:hypothetical protein